jgi:PBP1b-binding outer membrane lipoprotein LpoB
MAKEVAMKPVRRFACLAVLAVALAGCSYGYAAPYTRYGTGPEITFSPPSSQGVR